MQAHLVLGLLRDGRSRHGYELIKEYKARSGNEVSAGSFYRELGRLTSEGLLQTGVNPPEVDARRIPYQITAKGRSEFDHWLTAASTVNDEFEAWLLFVDRVTPQARDRLLERVQEDLWLRSKRLARLRDDALEERRSGSSGRYDPLPAVIARRLKQIAAELEFLKELRLELDAGSKEPGPVDEAAQPIFKGPRGGGAVR